jgi:hypothetical protein
MKDNTAIRKELFAKVKQAACETLDAVGNEVLNREGFSIIAWMHGAFCSEAACARADCDDVLLGEIFGEFCETIKSTINRLADINDDVTNELAYELQDLLTQLTLLREKCE